MPYLRKADRPRVESFVGRAFEYPAPDVDPGEFPGVKFGPTVRWVHRISDRGYLHLRWRHADEDVWHIGGHEWGGTFDPEAQGAVEVDAPQEGDTFHALGVFGRVAVYRLGAGGDWQYVDDAEFHEDTARGADAE